MMAHSQTSSFWHHKPPPGKSSKLLPVAIAIFTIAAVAWISYQVYATFIRFRDNAARSMGKKHVVWSKDGVRVGYRYVDAERYVGQTQNIVVKAWNLARGHDGDVRDDMTLKDRWKHMFKHDDDAQSSPEALLD